jgi:hypothetical protein
LDKRTAIYSVFVMVIVLFSVVLLNNISGKSEIAFNYPEIMKKAKMEEPKEITNVQTENKEVAVVSQESVDKVEDYSDIEFNRILYPGMGGDDVKKAQYLLEKAGYYKGEVNGYFDDSTKRAVILYQKDNNITQTGNIGDMTQKSLNN